MKKINVLKTLVSNTRRQEEQFPLEEKILIPKAACTLPHGSSGNHRLIKVGKDLQNYQIQSLTEHCHAN